MSDSTEADTIDPITDTGKFKALLEENKAQILDGVRRILQDEREKTKSLLYDVFTWLAGKFKK
jgi:hypothetical protein